MVMLHLSDKKLFSKKIRRMKRSNGFVPAFDYGIDLVKVLFLH